MTIQPSFTTALDALKDRFLTHHFDRHDRLELLLEQMRKGHDAEASARQAEALLHKIAGAAGSLGLAELGKAAMLVETFLRAHLATQPQDFAAIGDALDAFLDVSLEVCNPTDFPAGDDQVEMPASACTPARAATSAA